MQPRRSVRQRRKALAKDEKYAVLKGATPAKPEKAPSPDAEVLSDDDASEMFAPLALGRDVSPERDLANVKLISGTTLWNVRALCAAARRPRRRTAESTLRRNRSTRLTC